MVSDFLHGTKYHKDCRGLAFWEAYCEVFIACNWSGSTSVMALGSQLDDTPSVIATGVRRQKVRLPDTDFKPAPSLLADFSVVRSFSLALSFPLPPLPTTVGRNGAAVSSLRSPVRKARGGETALDFRNHGWSTDLRNHIRFSFEDISNLWMA